MLLSKVSHIYAYSFSDKFNIYLEASDPKKNKTPVGYRIHDLRALGTTFIVYIALINPAIILGKLAT